MAHYALLDENNIVTQVIVGKDENELDNEGNVVNWEQSYSEVTGQVCKRTSRNTRHGIHLEGGTPFRKNFGDIGFYYDADWDAFRPPQPYPSWKLDYDKFVWVAPIPMPEEGETFFWKWGEVNQEWIKVDY